MVTDRSSRSDCVGAERPPRSLRCSVNYRALVGDPAPLVRAIRNAEEVGVSATLIQEDGRSVRGLDDPLAARSTLQVTSTGCSMRRVTTYKSSAALILMASRHWNATRLSA